MELNGEIEVTSYHGINVEMNTKQDKFEHFCINLFKYPYKMCFCLFYGSVCVVSNLNCVSKGNGLESHWR